MAKINQIFTQISSLITLHISELGEGDKPQRLSEILNYTIMGENLSSQDINALEQNTQADLLHFRQKYNKILAKLDSIEHKNVDFCRDDRTKYFSL